MAAVRGANFRCYERINVALPGGLVGVVGPNGAGKTSLLELIHFACLGYSPRTSSDQELVRFGCDVLRAEADVELAGGSARPAVGYRPGDPKRATVDGSPVRSIDRLLARFPVLVFTPDRLRLVQGPPALRRSYFDRVLARMWPAQAALASEYGRVLVQRNHLLRRIRAGQSPASGLDPWDEMAARTGAALGAARSRLCHALAPVLARRLTSLGGAPGPQPLLHVAHTAGGERELREALVARRRRDIDRAATGAGPHLDDYRMEDDGRDLRRYGSQGEQRRMLLGLILAEADLIERERDEQPLLLLDDVTGEFDAGRRELLLEAVSRFQQAILTTTDAVDLGAAAAVVTVREGTVTPP
ncbi:MAG: DNA replication/repair protein RecF [Gaiellales bacterium]